MLKEDIIWPDSRRYKSRTEWEPIGFFSEGLCNANRFNLMLGFFSSSAIAVLSDGFASFLYNGGTMRLIVNDILTEQDKKAIEKGHTEINIPAFDLNNIEALRDTLSARDQHFFECLSWLIRNKRIDIRIISPKSGIGISHTKCGIMSDGANMIAFDGSCNFSKNALVDNIESITVSCDWDGPTEVAKIHSIEEDFEDTFAGMNSSVNYIDATNVTQHITSSFKTKEIEELLEDEAALIEKSIQSKVPETVKAALIKAHKKVKDVIDAKKAEIAKLNNIDKEPHFPYPSGPREYQQLAFNNWKDNGQKGLFAMATGTGKTITSLNCLLEIYKRKGYYKAIILVPTITLVNQWEKECKKFNFANIVKVFSKNPSWKDEIERIRFNENYKTDKDPEPSYIIISTYASFTREKVFKVLTEFDKRRLLIIADECHNMGSGQIVKKLDQIPYLRRIGLSATPERQFDDIGNKKLNIFFGSENGYTYEYSMEEAIHNGVLCKYNYYPHIVELTSEEMEAYVELSEKISKYFNYNTCTFDNIDDVLKMLLLARKRIIHKAVNKVSTFRSILKERLEKNGSLKYSLVYVPEGCNPDHIAGSDDFDLKEEIGDDEDANHLINLYTKVVTDVDDKVTVRRFVSGQKDRDEILEDFANGKLHVLTSMKCLDEGVDVPRSELAIFCSSTGNPRQFIQRRGRVLRTHPDKKLAEIHDLVVVPKVNPTSNSFRMEQSLLMGELKRVNNFALLSENPSFSELELNDVMNYYGVNMYNNDHITK